MSKQLNQLNGILRGTSGNFMVDAQDRDMDYPYRSICDRCDGLRILELDRIEVRKILDIKDPARNRPCMRLRIWKLWLDDYTLPCPDCQGGEYV